MKTTAGFGHGLINMKGSDRYSVYRGPVTGNAGVTLLELMVVLAIVGLILSMAIPNYLSTLPKKRIKIAARDAASAMQLARTSAISKNSPVRVVFDLNSESFQIMVRTNKATDTWAAATNVSVHSGDWVDVDLYSTTSGGIGSLVDFYNDTSVNNRVTFLPDGTADMPSTVTKQALYIRNKSNPDPSRRYRVVVNKYTGMATVETWTGGAWE